MICRLVAFTVYSLIPLSSLLAEVVDVSSHVAEVTLFPDRAMVTRIATTSIPSGISVVRFSDVPDSLDKDTLKVNGKGTATFTISSVDYRSIPVPKSTSPKYSEVEGRIEQLESELRLIKLELERLNSQKKLVSRITLDAGMPQKGGEGYRPRTAQEMKEVLNFVGASTEALDGEIEKAQIKEKEATSKLRAARRELESLGSVVDSRSVVEVSLEAKEATPVSLSLTYQIVGASWRPTYNLLTTHADSSTEFTLDSYALMRQQTGEDWNDIDLVLSTARPALGLNRPEPHPLDLQIYEPRPIGLMPQSMEMSGAAPMRKSSAPAAMEAFDAADMNVAATEETAELSKFGAITMKLPRKFSLKSDGSEVKVKVQSSSLSGTTRDVSVPYLSAEVFEEAMLKNGDAPLLPGEARIFADGTFVGAKALEFVPPGKEVSIPIGVSQSLGVVRKLTKKFEDDPGVVRSFRRVTVQYSIEIENYSAQERHLVLMERGIVSQNEKIKVTPITFSPEPLSENDSKRISKVAGVWEWHMVLKPKEKQVVTYEVSVEIPAGVAVPGLDLL